MTRTEQYWNDFAASLEELVKEWQEQYDPDGELSTLELLERVMACEPVSQVSALYNALGESVFDLSDEDVREEMQADGEDVEALRADLLRVVKAQADPPCDHQEVGIRNHETLEWVGLCAKCGDELGDE